MEKFGSRFSVLRTSFEKVRERKKRRVGGENKRIMEKLDVREVFGLFGRQWQKIPVADRD